MKISPVIKKILTEEPEKKKEVDLELTSYVDKLADRRRRLKELLTSEEKAHREHIAARMKQEKEAELDDMKKAIETYKAEEEARRKQLVEEKLEQKFRDCSQVREFFSQESRKTLAKALLEQMEHKMSVKKQKKNEEEVLWQSMWHEKHRLELELNKSIEDQLKRNNAQLKEEWNKQVCSKQNVQKEYERLLECERHELEKLVEKAIHEEEMEKRERENQKSWLKKIRQDDLEQSWERRKLIQEQEKEMEKTTVGLEELILKDRVGRTDNKLGRSYYDAHRERTEYYKQKRLEIEKLADEIIGKEAEEIFQRRQEREETMKLATQSAVAQMSAFRKKQIEERKTVESLEQEENNQLAKFHNQMLKEYDQEIDERRKRELSARLSDAAELRQQIFERDSRRELERQAAAARAKKESEENITYDEKIQNLKSKHRGLL